MVVTISDRRRRPPRGRAEPTGALRSSNGARLGPGALVIAAACLLSGCVEPDQETLTVLRPAPLPPPQASPMALPPAGDVVIQPEAGLDLEDGLPAPVNAACMSAVSERSGEFNVRVLANEGVAQGTEVTIGVGEDATPWRCVADPAGEIVEVSEVGLPS